jgi:hypothetical protein
MYKSAIVILFAMFHSICIGGTRDPAVPDQKYLEYGRKHECVVPIYGQCECSPKPHEFAASAVVISPRWIITAAHVLKQKANVKIRIGEKEHLMKRLVMHSLFDEEKIGQYDIAMAESEEEMKINFYPKLYESDDEVGRVASICGYGIYGTFETGSVHSDGNKRAGANKIKYSDDHVLFCFPAGSRKTNMDFIIAHGDSGGGLFIDRKLAGINSFVSATDGKPDSNYGDECAHTRISIFLPWIRETMELSGKEEK